MVKILSNIVAFLENTNFIQYNSNLSLKDYDLTAQLWLKSLDIQFLRFGPRLTWIQYIKKKNWDLMVYIYIRVQILIQIFSEFLRGLIVCGGHLSRGPFVCGGCLSRGPFVCGGHLSVGAVCLWGLFHTGISCQNFFHSTIIPAWKVSWVSKEAKKLKELEFVCLVRCFSAKMD